MSADGQPAKSQEVEYVRPYDGSAAREIQERKQSGGNAEAGDANSGLATPHRTNPYGDTGGVGSRPQAGAPMMTYSTGEHQNQKSSFSRGGNKQKRQETEFPALFCDHGDCTLG